MSVQNVSPATIGAATIQMWAAANVGEDWSELRQIQLHIDIRIYE